MMFGVTAASANLLVHGEGGGGERAMGYGYIRPAPQPVRPTPQSSFF